MIRSLFNLNYKINKHINNLHPQKKFKLLDIKPLLEQYKGDDWMDYKVKMNSTEKNYNNYKRMPIVFDELNQSINDNIFGMYLIEWNSFCHTSVHNHPEGGCLMKILDGSIIEQRFMNAESFSTIEVFNTNDISYINDNLGIHRIMNDKIYNAYSLHIYSPNLITNTNNQNYIKPLNQSHNGVRRVTDYPIM